VEKLNSPDECLSGRPVPVPGHSPPAEHEEQQDARTQQQRPLAEEHAPQQLGSIHQQQYDPEAEHTTDRVVSIIAFIYIYIHSFCLKHLKVSYPEEATVCSTRILE
jgi:hypothetical protein